MAYSSHELRCTCSVRRNTDPHLIHANVDTDIVISEENLNGSLRKPEEMYNIIEHFCLGRRRLELFGEVLLFLSFLLMEFSYLNLQDHNIRPGWITIGNKISSSNWNREQYQSYFVGQNGHLLGTTDEIEALRPKSPTRDDSKLIKFNPGKKVPNKGPPDVDIGPDGQVIVPPPPPMPLMTPMGMGMPPMPMPMPVPMMIPMGMGGQMGMMQGYQ